jgi:uncharacterized protein (TIGR03435 family)
VKGSCKESGGDRRTLWIWAVTLLCVSAQLGVCLPNAEAQTFDVVSVRPHVTPTDGSLTVSGPRITIEGFSIFGLIMYAYGIRSYQLTNSAQLNHTMYDIVAEIEDGRKRTREDFRPYVENLLTDRFKLQVHWEEKEAPVYALVVGKTGVKFKESDPAAKPTRVGRAISPTARGRELTWTGATMEELADLIRNSDGLDRLVVDETDLKGRYDIKIAYVAQNRMGGQMLGEEDVDIFTALPQQLGLVLEARKTKVKLMVVDHSERPAEN